MEPSPSHQIDLEFFSCHPGAWWWLRKLLPGELDRHVEQIPARARRASKQANAVLIVLGPGGTTGRVLMVIGDGVRKAEDVRVAAPEFGVYAPAPIDEIAAHIRMRLAPRARA